MALQTTNPVAILLIISFFSVFWLCIKRLYFHPLSKVPGPLLNKLTGWAHWQIAVSGRRHRVLYELHQKYGPVVRIGPNFVSFNSATALNQIYGDRKAPIIKGTFYEAPAAAERGWSVFSVRSMPQHAFKRRLLAHAFSEKSLRDSEVFISKNINVWLEQLGAGPTSDKEWTEPKNVAQWINYLTFDVLTDLCYGRSFDLLTRKDMRFAAGLIPDTTRLAYGLGYHPLRVPLSILLFRTPLGEVLGGQVLKNTKRLTNTSREFMMERRSLEISAGVSNTTTRKDFFYHLFKGIDPETGEKFTNEELFAESNNFVVAGADTTSTTLACCVFNLLRYPEVLLKLRTELQTHFAVAADVNYYGTQLGTLPYLKAVINEALRQTPPVSGGLHREVIGNGIVVDDIKYPAGTEVCVPHYALMRSPEYYPDPFAFKPERWLVDKETGVKQQDVDMAQFAFCPFSIGVRGCIGKNLAYMELSVALARLVLMFDMEEVNGWENSLRPGTNLVTSKGEYFGEDVFVTSNTGPLVRFRRREITS